jgi:hypothetical protein
MTNNIPMAKLLLTFGARESPMCKYILGCRKGLKVIKGNRS